MKLNYALRAISHWNQRLNAVAGTDSGVDKFAAQNRDVHACATTLATGTDHGLGARHISFREHRKHLQRCGPGVHLA